VLLGCQLLLPLLLLLELPDELQLAELLWRHLDTSGQLHQLLLGATVVVLVSCGLLLLLRGLLQGLLLWHAVVACISSQSCQ
jgi:uncharacterized membrane protein